MSYAKSRHQLVCFTSSFDPTQHKIPPKSCSFGGLSRRGAIAYSSFLTQQQDSCDRLGDANSGRRRQSLAVRSEQTDESVLSTGKFGRFGGVFVPETLVSCLKQLVSEFHYVLQDREFQEDLSVALRDYVGRETPLYFAQRLTDYYKKSNGGHGPDIYLKREDLSHGGAHKINNALAQAMIAKRMGRNKVVAATGAGQHGVATAAACAKLGLECVIYMGNIDMKRQSSNVTMIKNLGAKVISVEGTFKDATSESIRSWVGNLDTTYFLAGTAVGPHPCPSMVSEFQSIIGKETRRQATEKWGGKPDVVLACIGSGSNALGIFREFVKDEDVRLIGVEAGGNGGGKHSATLSKGEVGVYHGSLSYLLQDDEGQILGPHSIGVGIRKEFQLFITLTKPIGPIYVKIESNNSKQIFLEINSNLFAWQ